MKLAGYRIDAVIGQGGMGTVYRAEQLRLRRDVALKIMAPDLARDAAFRERFLRESQVAASLEHPHVVPVFDAGEADEVLYIAMRYVRGSDLRALIRREQGIAPGVTLAVLKQVAGALDAAHALGLVHRDVKPSNVLIEDRRGSEGPVASYLTDFGLSKRAVESSGGTMGRPLGSVNYMSPEQIRGEQLDARSDVYSLGCLLCECLTGEVPFARDSAVAVLYAHLEAPPPRVGDGDRELPAAVDDVLAWALAKAPADRPGSAGELAEALADVLGGEAWSSPARNGAPAGAMALAPVDSERPIVGRLQEQGDLLAALDEATAGRGNVVLLVGEPGIGKTTLAHGLSEEARRRGLQTVWGTGGAFGEAPPPYWHWVQVVRGLALGAGGAELLAGLGGAVAWLTAIAPDIASGLPQAQLPSAAMGAGEGRFHIYDALAHLLGRAAGTSGLVIVLDDLHLADEASLLALAFIAGAVRETGVLILGTYREGDLAPAGGEQAASPLAELAGSSRRISLEGLDPEHVARLIAARTEGEAPEALVERVHELTSGNPLFVSELLNLLETQGSLADSQIAPETLALPKGISDAISQRLAPLPARGRRALSVGAVIGSSFRAGTLARAAGIPGAELLEHLDQAAQLGLIRPLAEPADGYAFSHGLVQATLYEALPRGRRCRLHAAVGEALEHAYDVAAGAGLAEVAYHFLAAAPAGDEEKAVAYARRAAERAVETFAYDQAITLYTRSLELVDSSRGSERISLLQALGEAQMRSGDTEAARATLQRAAETARAHGDPAALARAALASNIWGLSFGTDEPLVRVAEEAVEQLEGGDSPGLLACVKGQLAAAIYWSGDVERRERLAAEALALARSEHKREGSIESGRMLGYVLGRYLLARWGPRSAQEDLPVSDELLELARQTRDPELEILARNWRVSVLLETGSFAAVDQEISRVEQMARELRQPRAMVFLPLHHATRAGTAGRFEEAERLNAESMQIGLGVQGTVGALAGRAQLVSIRLQQGRLAELEGPVTAIANAHPGMVAWGCVRALILVQTGRHPEAGAELERLLASGLDGIPRDNLHIVALALLAEVAAELGDRPRGQELRSWLEPYAGRWVVSPGAAALWPVHRSLGRLATVAGSPAQALEHIVRAREQAARAGARPSIALAALDEARLLAAGGHPDDRARVTALAREARELAQDLGMGLVVDAATLVEAEQGEAAQG
jgi:ATP/maltotriose-dependent transcriptional regulator MalT